MPKRISTARKPKLVNKRKISPKPKPMFAIRRVIEWTITISAVLILLGVVLQFIFPANSKRFTTSSGEDVSSMRESSHEAMWTGYNVGNEGNSKRMMYDEEGILRDADEIRIDDLGRPIWVGGGLRRSDI